MEDATAILTANFFVAHGLMLIAWFFWFWQDRRATPPWRRYVLLLGIASPTLNAAIFWGTVAYSNVTRTNFITLRDDMNYLITALPLVAIACGILGKGAARGIVAAAGLSGFLLWVVPAIL